MKENSLKIVLSQITIKEFSAETIELNVWIFDPYEVLDSRDE